MYMQIIPQYASHSKNSIAFDNVLWIDQPYTAQLVCQLTNQPPLVRKFFRGEY